MRTSGRPWSCMKRVGPAAKVRVCAAKVVRVARGEQYLPGAKLIDTVSELTLVAIRTAATSYPRAAELSLQGRGGGRDKSLGWQEDGAPVRWPAQSGGLEYITGGLEQRCAPVPTRSRGTQGTLDAAGRMVRRQGQAPCIWPDLWRGARSHDSCGCRSEPSVHWDRRLLSRRDQRLGRKAIHK